MNAMMKVPGESAFGDDDRAPTSALARMPTAFLKLLDEQLERIDKVLMF